MHSGAGPIIDRRHGNEAVGAEDVLIGGRQARAHPAPPHPPSDAAGPRHIPPPPESGVEFLAVVDAGPL